MLTKFAVKNYRGFKDKIEWDLSNPCSYSFNTDAIKDGVVKNGIIFKRMSDGKWGISLYNTNLDDTFHCGEYLKKNYKGGGHVGAAGCQVTEAKFKRMLKTKTI